MRMRRKSHTSLAGRHSRGLAPCMPRCGRLQLAAGVRRAPGTIRPHALVYVLGRVPALPLATQPGSPTGG